MIFLFLYFQIRMKVTITSISGDSGVFSLDVSEDLEIENFKVVLRKWILKELPLKMSGSGRIRIHLTGQ